MKSSSESGNVKKRRKPVFAMQDSWKRKRISRNSWRKPRGLHSKMRLKKRGNLKTPSHGYRSPKSIRALTPAGNKMIVVSSMKQLALVEGKDMVLSSKVGNRKKLEIIKAAQEKKIVIINLNPDELTKKIATGMEERKKKRALRKQKVEFQKKPEEKTGKSGEKPVKAETSGKKKGNAAETGNEEAEKEKRKKSVRESEKIITKRN